MKMGMYDDKDTPEQATAFGDQEARRDADDVSSTDPGDSIGLEQEFDRLASGLCAEGSELERGEALARMKLIYERLHPETAVGGARGKAGGGKVANDPESESFVSKADTLTGFGRTTIYTRMEIAAHGSRKALAISSVAHPWRTSPAFWSASGS